ADLYVEMVKKAVGGFQATQHFSTNHHHVLHGNEATSNAYVTAQHVFVNPLGDNENTIGGFYNNHFVRTNEGWRIDKLQLNLTWSKGNRHIYQLAAEALSG
ncbi:MAG: nuclear transport factor 2 family protein, partial [Alphaproteobacteria bacterium]|nr:nuclear transport factor 2 family protein [Alphaproteobacteria bacterium]